MVDELARDMGRFSPEFFSDRDLNFIGDMEKEDLEQISTKQIDYIESLYDVLIDQALPYEHAAEKDD